MVAMANIDSSLIHSSLASYRGICNLFGEINKMSFIDQIGLGNLTKTWVKEMLYEF